MYQSPMTSRVLLLLNFDELEKCSGLSVGDSPTIETIHVPIDKNRDIFASDIIEASANQFKTLISEIEHGRRKID